MASLAYLTAYAGIAVFLAIIVRKCATYRKKPMHVRWELYPVAHEEAHRAARGGSYLEESGWWRKKHRVCLCGSIVFIALEVLALHSSFRNNRALWYRAWPFHFGLYMLACVLCLAVLQGGSFLFRLGEFLSLAAFVCIAAGAAGLMHRRLSVPDLKQFSTPEHFLNLGLFLGVSLLGLILWLSMPSFFGSLCVFAGSLLRFSFAPQDNLFFNMFIIWFFAMLAYVPATHMGHFFMKYFLWHDIRWGNQPSRDRPGMQRRIDALLARPLSWKAEHIAGDGKKTWAEAAKPKE